jgi:class 3 adenylate cyclase
VLQLRIGIHVGAPEYFENSWHGTDVDTAARAQAAGPPGQIVVTEAAREAVGDPLISFIGRSRTWPTLATTSQPAPSALWIFFVLFGLSPI